MADRIIVVDDEREIADLIGLYLENDGYEVHKFLNGADALSFVEKCEPALAVLDVMLPDTDGFALLRKMREKHDFPIIMLTARVTDSDKILGLTIGADDYITKPFNPLEVTARVKTVLRRCRRGAETIDEMDIRGLTINRAVLAPSTNHSALPAPTIRCTTCCVAGSTNTNVGNAFTPNCVFSIMPSSSFSISYFAFTKV